MITFSERPSMLEPNALFLQWKIEGEQKQRTRKIDYRELTNEKNSIVKFEVLRILRDLYNQRLQVYRHAGHKREETIIAMQHLESRLRIDFFPSMPEFFSYILDRVIPHFKVIQPGNTSRYKNFEPTLNRVISFCETCNQYYQNRKNKAISKTTDCQAVTDSDANLTYNSVTD